MDEDRLLMEKFPSLIASAVVGIDGEPLSMGLPSGMCVQTFSIMCATILGASATANKEFGGGRPESVLVEGEGIRILVVPAGRRKLLACVAKAEDDTSALLKGMKEITASIQ
ncbi:MAG: roadblock/LC7 domain-containing protein [Thermoplasmata archaeon]|nr:roadblock/LC7 domain-containing protein [Thermoplasmata archaeon]